MGSRPGRQAIGHRRWLWAVLLLCAQVAAGLDPHRGLDHYGHQVWRTDSGLPQNTVHAILQTRDGYLWLGTEGGLVRFDGIDFVTFDAENTPQLASDTVFDLMQDDAGTLWISTAVGLLSYRDGVFQAYTAARGLPADTVWFSYQDRRHRVWALTSAGPAVLDGRRFTAIAGAQAATPLNRQALAEDGQGRLWLGGSNGVFVVETRRRTSANTDTQAPLLSLHLLSGSAVNAVEVDGLDRSQTGITQTSIWLGTSEGLKHYARGVVTDAPLPGNEAPGHRAKTEVTALHPDAIGGLWVGTSDGLVHLGANGSALPVRGSATEVKRVNRFFTDRAGVLWIAAERGIFRMVDDQLQSFAAGSDLAGSQVLAIFEDREGDMWLGSDAGGLHLLRDQKFITYTSNDGLSGNVVRCVFQSANGELWIGTDGAGLNRRTSSGFVHFTTADGLTSNVILSLADGANGDLWVGTPDGLNLLHSDGVQGNGQPRIRVQRFTAAEGLPDEFIRSLYTDRDGSLWIGTRHGLSHLSGGKFTNFTSMDGLGSDLIGVLLRDRGHRSRGERLGDLGGDLWIGTSGGLSRLHDGKFDNDTTRQGLANNTVTAISQGDPKTGDATTRGEATGNQPMTLWLGTNGGGLNRLQRTGEQRSIAAFPFSAKGLPGSIYSILEDGQGELWLSSSSGIYRVSVAELRAYATGARRDFAVSAYGTADGMNIRECSEGGHPAGWKLADGSLWFATLDGVSTIDPAHAPENNVAPPVVIEKVLVNDQLREGNAELTLPPGANRLEFQYVGLSFVAPQKVQYRYRLKGFDRDWIDAGNRRSAFYTNLPPARYQFEVIAANNDGVWNKTGASLDLRLLPHYYQTWWFYTALAMAGLLLGYLMYRWRVMQVEAQFGAVMAERGRLAREIHDTLAQGFVAISVQLELVARLLTNSRQPGRPVDEPVMEHLDAARAMVRGSLDEARTSIWDLRSSSAGAEDLPTRLRQGCDRISSGSPCKVYLQVKGTYRPVERRMEEELLRIGQEAVANAVRHAGAGRIDVELMYAEAEVALRVADDGRGFEPLPGGASPAGHYGIQGMHERAELIDATLVVESTPGAGTQVLVNAPLS
jgi:ligand-binding sensor domain-containing protein/signal transduction histidine kinase